MENFAYLGEDNAVVWLDALGMDTNHLKLVSNTILAIMRVRQVLEEQVRLNSLRLIDRTLEETSLLALAVGQNYLPCLAGSRSDQDSIEKSDSSGAESLILTKLDEILKAFETGGGIRPQGRKARAKPGFPTKRDAILFAAIASNLTGPKFCDFLDKHKVKPKWSDDGPKSYRESYMGGGSYQKKVQDEKTRAKQRMSKHSDSVLMEGMRV